ncbi:DUF4962 domain-containing protein [Fervidibacillus albus]|uniref:DUF4962 domain-containing protein n=1 Tax=Fervidibacillus albus TaxID=2980026 RepID=A0A9E8LST2_9BACI|nr:DUF4962 domain-containing protein [Fervidibacillus albus]WAA08944.1 DUF4962 domain-containing protein [Fervidibacillus albus]
MPKKKYLFINHDIDELRKEIQTIRKPLYKRLYEVCRLYANQPLPEKHPPQSITFMGMASLNLSLAYLLTRQKHYLDEAKRWIFTAVKYPRWGHAHLVDVDLSASWLLFGLGLSYNWLKDELSLQERTLLKDKLILQSNKMYDFVIQMQKDGMEWPVQFWQNHNWINFTGLATAAYALGEEYEQSKQIIDHAKKNFDFVYEVLADDGSNYEGVVYWRYGVIWLFIYAHLLKYTEGIDYFKKSDFMKQTFFYRLYQAAPNLEEIINFGDCHDRRSGHSCALYYKIASEYTNNYAQYLGNLVREHFLYREQYESGVKPGILHEAGLEFLWYNPEIKEKRFDDLPLVKYFEDLGLIVVRSSWEQDAIHFSFKSGHPGGKKQWEKSYELFIDKGWKTRGLAHQHPDNNSFILHAHDSYLAIDDGYNRTVKACEHNVVIVDGKGYPNEGHNDIWEEWKQDCVSEIEEFVNEDDLVYFVGEAHKMYDPTLQLTRFARHVFYTGKDYFVIFDDLNSDQKHTYTWIMHTDTTPNVRYDEVRTFEYENGPAKMNLYSVIPKESDYKFKNTVVRAIMTTQEPDKFRETKMRTIHIENKEKSNSMCFLNVISIRKAFDEENIQIQRIDRPHMKGVIVKKGEDEEVYLFSKSRRIEYQTVKADAEVVLLQYKNEQLVKFMVKDCNKFSIDGNELIKEYIKKTVIKSCHSVSV